MRLTPKVCEVQNQQPHRSCNFGTGVFGALYESAKHSAALEAHAPRMQDTGCKTPRAQAPGKATSIRQCTSKSVSKGVHMFTTTSTRRQFVAGAAGLAAVAAMGGVQLAKADEAASSIVDGTYAATGIGYATELRLTKKKGEGIPVRIANDSHIAVSILHSLTDPINKYIYRTKKGVDFIRRKLGKEGIVLLVKGEPKEFNTFHFGIFVDFYNMKGNDTYSYNLSLGGEQPSWGYSQQAIDLMLQEIRRDPEHVIDSMRAELSRRKSGQKKSR